MTYTLTYLKKVLTLYKYYDKSTSKKIAIYIRILLLIKFLILSVLVTVYTLFKFYSPIESCLQHSKTVLFINIFLSLKRKLLYLSSLGKNHYLTCTLEGSQQLSRA